VLLLLLLLLKAVLLMDGKPRIQVSRPVAGLLNLNIYMSPLLIKVSLCRPLL